MNPKFYYSSLTENIHRMVQHQEVKYTNHRHIMGIKETEPECKCETVEYRNAELTGVSHGSCGKPGSCVFVPTLSLGMHASFSQLTLVVTSTATRVGAVRVVTHFFSPLYCLFLSSKYICLLV